MIHFTTIPLNYEGTLEDNVFSIPESPSTQMLLNAQAMAWKGKRYGSMDPELELYNFVADGWPFMKITSRVTQRRQLPLTFSLS